MMELRKFNSERMRENSFKPKDTIFSLKNLEEK